MIFIPKILSYPFLMKHKFIWIWIIGLFLGGTLLGSLAQAEEVDCSLASFVKLPNIPKPKCATIPEDGNYQVEHGSAMPGPVPLNVGQTKTSGKLIVSECGKTFLFLQGGKRAQFKRTKTEGIKSFYETSIGRLKFTLETVNNTFLKGRISGGPYSRDFSMSSGNAIPEEMSQAIKKCWCSEIRDHLEQRRKDQKTHEEELKLGKILKDGTRTPWRTNEGIPYRKQVRKVVQEKNRSPGFSKMVETLEGGTAGMRTNWNCEIETFEKVWAGKECFAPIDWTSSYFHEMVHKKTCCAIHKLGEKHWENERKKHAQSDESLRQWEGQNPKYKNYKEYMDNPVNFMKDEYNSYQVSIDMYKKWLTIHCGG